MNTKARILRALHVERLLHERRTGERLDDAAELMPLFPAPDFDVGVDMGVEQDQTVARVIQPVIMREMARLVFGVPRSTS